MYFPLKVLHFVKEQMIFQYWLNTSLRNLIKKLTNFRRDRRRKNPGPESNDPAVKNEETGDKNR